MNNGGFASVSGNIVTVKLGGMWLLSWGINFGDAIHDLTQYLGNVRQNATTVLNGTLLQQLGSYPGRSLSGAGGGLLQMGSVIPPTFLAPGDTLRLQGKIDDSNGDTKIRGNASIGTANTFIAGTYLGPTM
jgi:hypothetical protein